LGALMGAGCGTGGAGADTSRVCGLVERLAATATAVERADVADPDAFAAALEAAVAEYRAVLDELREVTPEELAGDLDRLEAAVTQYDFAEAVRARAALDRHAGRTCPSPAVSSSVPAPAGG
jgi:hypothetical protein